MGNFRCGPHIHYLASSDRKKAITHQSLSFGGGKRSWEGGGAKCLGKREANNWAVKMDSFFNNSLSLLHSRAYTCTECRGGRSFFISSLPTLGLCAVWGKNEWNGGSQIKGGIRKKKKKKKKTSLFPSPLLPSCDPPTVLPPRFHFFSSQGLERISQESI